MPKPRTKQMAAWRAFLEAHAALSRVLEDELQAAHELPLAWYDVLVQLSEAPGGSLRMQQLADSVLLSKSGLTRLFDRMEAARFVRRKPCDDDGRGTLAVITPSGRAVLKRAAPVHLSGIERHFARHLSDGNAAVLAASFARMRDALNPE